MSEKLTTTGALADGTQTRWHGDHRGSGAERRDHGF